MPFFCTGTGGATRWPCWFAIWASRWDYLKVNSFSAGFFAELIAIVITTPGVVFQTFNDVVSL